MRTSSLLFLLSSAILAVQSLPIPEPDLFSSNSVLQARTVSPATTKKSTSPSAAATSCPMRKGGANSIHHRSLEKRAPGKFTSANAPDTVTIKLGGVDYVLNKFSDQGGRALTYRVAGGAHDGAFAKTNIAPQEITDTTKVDRTIASGQDENTCNEVQATWLIVQEVHGKKFVDTEAYKAVKGKCAQCKEVLGRAFNLVRAELKSIHANHGINHNDASQDNCLFNDDVTRVEFIDFGEANKDLPSDEDLQHIITGQFPLKELCPK